MSSIFSQLLAELPQTQCGECGYTGCAPYAQALALGQASCNLCPPGGTVVWQQLQRLCHKHETAPPRATRPHRVWIDETSCIGCYKCVPLCPVDAIAGAPGRLHQINRAACTGCDLCLPACPVDCIHPQAMPDSASHYQHPQQVYAKRHSAWMRHQQQPATGSTGKPQEKAAIAPAPTTNLAIRARLQHAIARAKKNGDKQAAGRLQQQLTRLE